MPALEKSLRTKLENTVKAAREVAEAGARSSLEQIGVGDADAPKHLSEEEKNLRRRLRIHGRQLGDEPGQKKGTQTIERLVEEVAYEHWHRLLFASFLAANKLLMYPDPDEPVAVTISECEDMAADEDARNGWELAARYAARMLPQIFRIDSPVFELELPPESQQELERLVSNLPTAIYSASDSLGWVYQFWQANRKDGINRSEVKIGARELPAVTQLFTEDYMVDYLLDNTLGAWHAGKLLTNEGPLSHSNSNEQDLRDALALPGCDWQYLRLIQQDDGTWLPAAGLFSGWPRTTKALKCLDPCMGSGHFIVAMFERLVALRMAEENLEEGVAVKAVISENLFGLEIDPRCTQIAAFNLALASWRRIGFCHLPLTNLACSGLAPNVSLDEWVNLAGDTSKLREGMEQLYGLFKNAPILGSLCDPTVDSGDLLQAGFRELQPIVQKALQREDQDHAVREMAIAATGLTKAAELLIDRFTLVATNVPYLGRGKQDPVLQAYSEQNYGDSKADLATCFVERCKSFTSQNCTTALVTPQNWLFLASYKNLRQKMLKVDTWNLVARLGTGAFETIGGEVVNVALVVITSSRPSVEHEMRGGDYNNIKSIQGKAEGLRDSQVLMARQQVRLKSPDSVVAFNASVEGGYLKDYARVFQGLKTGDNDRLTLQFWEVPAVVAPWRFLQGPPAGKENYSGLSGIVRWTRSGAEMARLQGLDACGSPGIAVGGQSSLPFAFYTGELFESAVIPIKPNHPSLLLPIAAFCSHQEFAKEVRQIDSKVAVTTNTFGKVPFDLARWQQEASRKYPNGVPTPQSTDPTQWLFDGRPNTTVSALQVAVARLVGYRWPRQSGSSFYDCPALDGDELESFADSDGIVCVAPVRGEAGAADRLLNLMATAYGEDWSGDVLNRLLASAGFASKGLENWLRDGFFEQHLDVFQKRPFVWHIWDGLRDGFSALVNYHKLDHKNLETLIYTYLGDWISRCESEDKTQRLSEDGEKTTAAKNLKRKLEWILEGQAPYDIFVRWKPLHQQPIGWNPDINDGVRINIRPFVSVPDVKAKGAGVLRVNPKIKWDKDRGKESERSKQHYPWFWGWDEKTTDFTGGLEFKGERFNNCHYTLAAKQKARSGQ